MLRTRWETGASGIELGRELFEQVPAADRPLWASRVLALCHEMLPPIAEISALLSIASDDSRWREGHTMFDELRDYTLRVERAQRSDALKAAVLDVAETTAKIIYNESGETAPFDYHAGWRPAPRARRVAEIARDQNLEPALWTALVQPIPPVI